MIKFLDQIEKYIFVTALALYSVFVITTSSSPVQFSKLILLTIFATLAIIVWSARGFFKNTLSFATGKFDLAVLALVVAYVGSAIFRTPNKMEAFVIPGVATFVILSAVFYFLINQLNKQGKFLAQVALFASGVLLSLSLIFTQLGFFAKIPQLPTVFKDVNFNPLGGSVPSIIYLVVIAILGVSFVIREKELIKKTFYGVSLGILAMGLVIVIANSLPNRPQSPKFPSMQSSWEISVDTLKNSPVWGVGAGNYLTSFNLYRSVAYNASELWQVRFTTASNFYLTLITETGFVGLFAIALLLLAVYKNTKSLRPENFEDGLPAVFLILLAVLPASPILILPLFALLAVGSKSENRKFEIEIPTKVPSAIVGAFVIVLILIFDFYAFKYARAEATFKSALESLAKNDAKVTYETMQKAINQNPYVDRYHASLAQINMAIASSLANKKDITDAEKQTVTQLVQSAIAEGKSTITLNPQRSGNWEVLAQIYRSIMPFAQGADQFAIQTFTQAVVLDPTNPNLRISLGGVYYALGKYDEAIDSYKLAVLAKSDLPNAHYNLAIAYREKKDFDNAINEINTVMTLVAKDSQDYELAQNTLTDLEKKKATKITEAGESLTTPTQLEKSNIKPPIELPEDSTPPLQ